MNKVTFKKYYRIARIDTGAKELTAVWMEGGKVAYDCVVARQSEDQLIQKSIDRKQKAENKKSAENWGKFFDEIMSSPLI